MTYAYAIISIIKHGQGQRLAAVARNAGAIGATILVGRGSANSAILRMLAIGDIEKDVLIILVTANEKDAVYRKLTEDPMHNKKNAGISYCIYLGEKTVKKDNSHELITVITNRGYAEDIMTQARKAGARGGTILHARGTGKPEDGKFFGITIVPEKETILILAEKSNAHAIKDAISTLPCLSTPGLGIMYSTPVSDFRLLGKKENSTDDQR
ncbi:MAG TPA: transcriptional regulator [Treponema sp.]|nr:transcriptional regulator [Treponema sp.]